MKKVIQTLAIIIAIIGSAKLTAQSCCSANAGNNQTICCPGGHVTLGGTPASSVNCTGCDSVSYIWKPATGLNNIHIAHPTASPSSTTVYTLCIVSYKHDTCAKVCCVACSQVTITVNNSCCRLMGTNDPVKHLKADIKVFPNPAKTNLTIDINEPVKNADVNLYDSNGRLVLQKNKITDRQKLNIDVSQLPKGIYFIKILDENNEIYNDKILLE